MKKVFFLVLLLSSAPAFASTTPELKDTQAYKNLRSYTLFLESKGSATASEKASYERELASRVQTAMDEREKLFSQRKAQTQSAYDNILKKRYRNINASAESQKNTLKRQSKKKRGAALALFRKREKSIESIYGAKIRPLAKRITALRLRWRESDDPREKSLINEEILILQREVNRLRAIIDLEVGKAKGIYRRDVRRANRLEKNGLIQIEKDRKAKRKNALSIWKKERDQALADLREKRRLEGFFVDELRIRGEAAIAAMSPA